MKLAKQNHQVGDVYIVSDISGSMGGEKMDGLKSALKTVYRPGIKMYAFSDKTYEITENDIDKLHAISSTNMLSALHETWSQAPRHIILITDGQPNGGPWPILNAAQSHKDTPIDTIGISSYGRSDYDPEFLSELATLTGGKFTDCGKPIQLTSIIQNLLLGVGTSSQLKGGTIQI